MVGYDNSFEVLLASINGHQQAPIECYRIQTKQERIQVGCLPPACQLYVFWWPPLGVSAGRGYPSSHGVPIPQTYPPPLDIPLFPPWTYPPPEHASTPWTYLHPLDIPTSLLVTPGGHH